MIERQIVAANVKELEIQEYVTTALKNMGQSHIKLQRTPLGEKIIIHASRPGLIVGRKGANIKKLTENLKAHFKLENPQIEINEVLKPDLDAQIVAERIASSLEKFGTQRFKGIGHRVMGDVMNAGALGVEILITGKIPSSRSRRWRFWKGYLKKCGDVAIVGVRKAYTSAQIKTGSVGIQVRIMPPDIELPDYVKIFDDPSEIVEEMKEKIEDKEKIKKETSEKENPIEKEKPAEKKEKKTDAPVKTKKPKKTTIDKEEIVAETVKEPLKETTEFTEEKQSEPETKKTTEDKPAEQKADKPAEQDSEETVETVKTE